MLTFQRLTYDEACIILAGASAKAIEIGVPMCLAVVDESGNLVAFQRMDGGKIHSVTLAQDKAMAAAMSRKATHEYNELAVPGKLAFGIQTTLGGRFSTVGGGYPVMVDGQSVGGVGCSSGTPQQDMECVQAGIKALESHWAKA